MLNKKAIYVLLVTTAVAAVVFYLLSSFTWGQSNSDNHSSTINDNHSAQILSPPMIIWWGRMDDPHQTLRLALSSGVFSHVMLVCVHRYAGRDLRYRKNIQKALALCKQKGVTPIWTRWLYPGSELKGFTYEDAFSSEYYITQIQNIRAEAKQRGISLVAFDAEPYANLQLEGITRRRLSDEEMSSLNKAIEIAIKAAGKVDFVLPSSGELNKHFYNFTRHLGELTISEYTYYDYPPAHTPKIRKERPFDIFGAYVGITKENKYKPKLPLFTPREILARQDLWAHKKGVFVYPGGRKEAALVALEFSKIKTVYPVRDSNDVK